MSGLLVRVDCGLPLCHVWILCSSDAFVVTCLFGTPDCRMRMRAPPSIEWTLLWEGLGVIF